MATGEDTTLLHNSRVKKQAGPTVSRGKKKAVVVTSLIVIAVLTLFIHWIDQSAYGPGKSHRSSSNKKNLIFFVTDGMGPASLSLTRSFRQYVDGLPINDTLQLDRHLIGSSRTRSSDSLVTDSAAGATAFSCGLKSYNGAIGVDQFKSPCGTILEAAKLEGLLTGLVVTTRITDATPASFSAHADYRIQEDLIALHQIGEYPLGPVVDLIIGGGRTHFYPKSDPGFGSRTDGRNLIKEVQKRGWQYVSDRAEFDALQLGKNVSLPLLALLADNDIPFDLDRDEKVYPSLEEQTMTALTALSEATRDSDKGFFLLVEGSRIDHAGHQNDPSAQVREVLAFDKAFAAAMEFADNSDVETILISTSDHETGGLVTARQVTKEYPDYLWKPEVLGNSSYSGEYAKRKILNYHADDKLDFVRHEVLERDLGITDYTEEDVAELASLKDSEAIQYKINDMISFRAQIGWTTHGHSAVDVNIYAYANEKNAWYDILDHLQGNHENTEIGQYMAKYLGLDLGSVTEKVNKTKHSPDMAVKELGTSEVYDENYHKLIDLQGL
ncbi:alkaline phosphatase PHO8 KNAG_0A03980 [Huiozyma naganishii CBS 8797]|uniref:Alkaline phosphatase n=1 Tax=Huiozyma naganishii (strain ATCC MYA-139 / BCRC 22969 / CBS 8797 / KCTC 17520 / NBRC 10181 / NCYC 3082 / Yp74L-3) TaxID=1071383 RepID=J7RTL1_HUIN7|nr:hypothetical protein KNAG_0A03980 [Kazachstania naganishii CBS 8797]CCK68077.1 hypothetical protein KNAG_0A03980 [Kazachstania naganishii CBS 8797]